MTKKLKVYSFVGRRSESPRAANGDISTEEIVASTSITEVCRIAGISRTDYNWRGRIVGPATGDELRIELAMSKPGIIFWTPEWQHFLMGDSVWTEDGQPYVGPRTREEFIDARR